MDKLEMVIDVLNIIADIALIFYLLRNIKRR